MASTVRRPRQSDIAARMGVSISTVSRALANESGISPSVREQVLQVAQSIGYRTKHAAPVRRIEERAVALVPLGGATGGLAGFYVGITDGMRAAARDGGLELDIRLVNDELITPEQIQRHIAGGDDKSILLAGIDPSDELMDWFAENAISAVLVNGSDPRMRASSVAPANFYGARMATQMLLDAGHRRIMHYTHRHRPTNEIRPTIMERLRGFEAAIAAAPEAEGKVVSTDDFTARELAERIVEDDDGFTALFCWNDLAAVELLDTLHRQNGSGPTGFSVIGFDDLPYAEMTSPRLSTMHVDREAIGRAAIRIVLEHMAGETAVQQVEIGVTPVQGGTIHTLM